MDAVDHRRLGRQLDIFAIEQECGAGLPFWLSAGAVIRDELERFVVGLERRHGYRHVNTPVMGKRELHERSGHWAHYQQAMYPPMQVGAEQLVLRPMLCPHHIIMTFVASLTSATRPWALASAAPSSAGSPTSPSSGHERPTTSP